MFDSSDYHGQDLLFKDATIRAEPVGEKTTHLAWLGPDYVAALEGTLSQPCSGAGRARPRVGSCESPGWAGSAPTEGEQASCRITLRPFESLPKEP